MVRLATVFRRQCAGWLGPALAMALGGVGCSPPPPPPRVAMTPKVQLDLNRFTHHAIGRETTGHYPWVAHVVAVDLDQDGLLDALAAEAQDHEILWLRQTAPGQFEEMVVGRDLRAPVQVHPADLDGDGDLDLIVSSMGEVYPNNDRIGTLFILENDGKQHFTPHIVMEHVARVTDARAGDFNGDGKLDLAVAQFGYDQGEVQWLERTGPWTFVPHQLCNLAGAINVLVADFDGDRTLDIAAVISQQWEEVHLFQNDGRGHFGNTILFGSTNDEFASSNISLCDLNRDGRPDILYSNGDGFGPTTEPGPRPWHGVQWLENLGQGAFKFQRIGDLAGAYGPVAVDVDQDGAMDVVAVSAFNDWSKPDAVSLMWFRNDGRQHFEPHVLAHAPTHLLALAAGDFDGSGQPALISVAFHAYPPYDRISRIQLWQQTAPAAAPRP